MLKGTVKFFQKAKGFGFITPDRGGNEVFLPAAAIAPADMPRLKPGLRVTFEQAPDAKGPKVVSLKLLEEAPRPAAGVAAEARLTVLHDPSAAASDDVLRELGALGYALRLVDVMAAPPGPDELRKLSLMLGGSKLGLVRRHDPLFLALQLDDRFITEGEFWTAISQHPALINGPVLAMGGRAGVCKTRDDVRAFCGLGQPKEERPRKVISERLAALMTGRALPAPPAGTEKPAAPRARAETRPPKAKPAPRPKAKAAKSPKARPAAKAKKPAPAKPRKAAKSARKKR